MTDSERLPMIPACDVLLATLQHQRGEIGDDQWREALTLELASHENASEFVTALAIAAAGGLRLYETMARQGELVGELTMSTHGVVRNLKRGFLEADGT